MHACMYSHNNNVGLAPKIGLVLGQSWMVIPKYEHSSVMCKGISPLECTLIELAVVYIEVHCVQTFMSRSIFLCNFVVVYMYNYYIHIT